MPETKTYIIAGTIVEATKSEGGGFYDYRIVETGQRFRALAEVFESVAVPHLSNEEKQSLRKAWEDPTK